MADYEAWKAQKQTAGVGAASVVLGSVEDAPDQVAGDLTLAADFGKATGNPVPTLPMVKEYRNVFQQRIEEAKNKTVLSRSPRLTEWLRDPENAALAKDDVAGLSWFEGFGSVTDSPLFAGLNKGSVEGFDTAVKNTAKRAGERTSQMADQFMFEQTAGRARDRKMSLGQLIDDERETVQGPDGPVKMGATPSAYVGAMGRWLDAKYADLIGADDEGKAAEFAAGIDKAQEALKLLPKSEAARSFESAAMIKGATPGQALANFGQAFVANPGGALAWALETAGESAPQMAAGLGVTLATRSPMAGIAVSGAGSFATERYTAPADFLAEKGIDLGKPEDVQRLMTDPALMKEAADRGVIRGAVIAAFDTMSMGIAGRAISGNPFVEALAQAAAQAVTGSAGEYGARVASGQEVDWNEIIAEGFAELASTPVDMGTAGRDFARERKKSDWAEQRAAPAIAEVSANAQASPLRNRMPDRFRQYVEQATANGPAENVFVPAEDFVEYFQGLGVDPRELIESLDGVTADDLDVALAGGGDLRIPTATYAAKIAGSEADAFFMENMRFDPDEMTARQAKEFNEKSHDALDEAYQAAEDARLSDEQFRTADAEIYDRVVSDLRVAGRSTDVATAEAAPIQAFYRTKAERSGLMTEEYLARYPLPKIQGAIPEGMQLKDVDAVTRTLAALRGRKAGGADKRQSLLEFISEYGGINDPGGELRSRNAETVKRGKGKKTLRLSRGAMADMRDLLGGSADGRKFGVDDVAQAAIDAGFLADNQIANEYRAAMQEGREVPDIGRALFDAIDEELRAGPQFSADQAADPQAAENERLDEIEAYLASLGVSADDDDATIRSAMEASEGGRQYAQPQFLFQGDLTQTAAFKAWFGESKVVDAAGKPLVVYHGSPDARFEFFSEDMKGKRTGHDASDVAFHFTTDTSTADTYSGAYRVEGANAYEKITGKPLDISDMGRAPAIMPVYLAINNPLDVGQSKNITGETIIAAKAAGHDGIRASDGNGTEWVAFEATQIKSQFNVGAFDPADPRLLFQDAPRGPRGSIQFPAPGVGKGETIIRLFETANLSTFTHETGHLFLTMMQADARDGLDGAVQEYETIKAWWRDNAADVAKDGNRVIGDAGITADDVLAALDGGTTGDLLKDAAIDVGMQEQFARAYEAYILEGKAPSVALRSPFEKMRAWLLSVYKAVKALGVNLSPELRGVFDRMLASDREIAEAQATAGGALPTFTTAEAMGLTDEEFARFQKLRIQGEDEAKAKLLGEVMAPIKRERDKWFKDERAVVRAEMEAKVNGYRFYRAMEWMGNKRWFGEGQPQDMPDVRLSKEILVARYGEGVLKTLPRGKQTVYAVEGGMDPDEAAGWFGFQSGDELVQAMEKAPPRKQAIEDETDLAMRERHGDVLTDGAIEAQALDAVHNDKRGQWIAAELKAVADVAGVNVALTAKEARATARQTVARMRVRDAVASNRFLAAERKAGQEAARLGAMLARDKVYVSKAQRAIANKARAALRGQGAAEAVAPLIDRANVKSEGYNETVARFIEAKRRQLLNHALFLESRQVADEVEKAENFVAKLGKKSTRERIAGAGRRENAQIDYLSAIDDVLEQYDFRRLSAKAEDRRGSLNAFVAAMTAAGRENELSIPEAVLSNAARVPYKTLPVEEMRGVIDTLKNLEHVASRWDKLIDAQNQRSLDEATAEIVAAFDANLPKRPPGRVKTRAEALRQSGRQFLDVVLTATTLLREIDGFKDIGPAYRNIKAPIDAAMGRLISRKEKAAGDLEALYSVYTKDERRKMATRDFMPELGFALSKWERIAVALNTGNEGNRQRLTDPKVRGSLTDDQVNAVLATLDERDADFVQAAWDYIGTFKDDIGARERRTTGVEPGWVEASPVSIAGKALRGGYYPIKYDPRLSSLARDDETQEVAVALQAGRFGKAQTKNGHTKDRAQSSGRDVELDMSVMHRHVNQVIYDLELSEAVANSWRILQDGRVRGAFTEAGKQADFDALEIWLKDVAEGEIKSSDFIGRTARTLKSNFTAAKLAFNLVTVVSQVTGLAQTAVVVGKKDMARGVQMAFRSGVNAEIVAKSPFMSTRQTTFNKDIYDMFNDPMTGPVMSRWAEVKSTAVGKLGFWLMTKVQWYLVDVPTWLAGYQQGMRQFGNDEAKALAHADDIVKRAQASGLFPDRSAIERGSVSRTARQNDVVRLFTTLGSYMFAKFNVAYERGAKASNVIREEGLSARSAQEAMSWTIDMLFLFMLEAVVMGAIKGQLPGGDDDEEEGWGGFLAKQTAFSVMGTVPGIRDAVSVAQGFSGGGAYGGIVEEATKGAMAIGKLVTLPFSDDEMKKSDVRAIVNATGLATGLPSTQIWRAVDAKVRAMEGDDVSPLEFIMGKRG